VKAAITGTTFPFNKAMYGLTSFATELCLGSNNICLGFGAVFSCKIKTKQNGLRQYLTNSLHSIASGA
jgi:hypothetical protein